MYDWLDIKNKDSVGEILIYGTITDEKWFDEDVTPKDIRDQIKALKNVDKIDMYINSPGGGVFAGIAIYNMLKQFSSKMVSHADGLVGSIASVIYLAADRRIIPENAPIMIHNPMGVAVGDADEMRQTARLLDGAKKSILSIYKSATTLTDKKLSQMMDDETWAWGQDAYDLGFATEVEANKTIEAKIQGDYAIINGQKVDIRNFRKFPKEKIEQKQKDKEAIKAMEDRFDKFKTRFSAL